MTNRATFSFLPALTDNSSTASSTGASTGAPSDVADQVVKNITPSDVVDQVVKNIIPYVSVNPLIVIFIAIFAVIVVGAVTTTIWGLRRRLKGLRTSAYLPTSAYPPKMSPNVQQWPAIFRPSLGRYDLMKPSPV